MNAAALQEVVAAIGEPDTIRVGATAYDEETSRKHALEHCNRKFVALKADQRIEWALENLPGNHVLTSSFGAQAAVSLHLLTQVSPNIPVVLVDTGYLFPETYRFIDELTARMKLNLKVFRAQRSPSWQEARHGQRWNQGVEGLDARLHMRLGLGNMFRPKSQEQLVGPWDGLIARSTRRRQRERDAIGQADMQLAADILQPAGDEIHRR